MELRINPNTRINQLIHNKENQLSFCLQSAQQPSEYCLFPEDINNSPNLSNSDSLGELKLSLRKQPYIIDNDDKPGIRKLRYLSINPLQPQGLQTFISGKSKGIAVGLYREFPIESIQPSWLSKYFSPDAIAGIISFISAFTAVVLEKILFPDNP